MSLSLEHSQDGARTRSRHMAVAVLSLFIIPLGLPAYPRRGSPFVRRRQLYTGAPSLGQADRYGLPRGPRAMFSLADMMKFFSHKFARLSGGRFS